MNGDSLITLKAGEEFTDPGVVAADPEDGTLDVTSLLLMQLLATKTSLGIGASMTVHRMTALAWLPRSPFRR